MEGSSYNFVGYRKIRIPTTTAQGLGDYSKTTGYPEAAHSASFEEYTLNHDRGLKFAFDRLDEQDILGPSFNLVDRVFQDAMRLHIIPEYDAIRIADLAAAAKDGGKEVIEDIDNTNTIYAFDEAIQYYHNIGYDTSNLWCFISPSVAKFLKQDNAGSTLSRRIALDTFAGKVKREITSIEGIDTIIVPESRFWHQASLRSAIPNITSTNVGDIRTVNSFTNPSTARQINFLLVPKSSGIEAVTRHQQLKVFNPDINQNLDGWLIQFRTVYDIVIPKHKRGLIYLNRRSTK